MVDESAPAAGVNYVTWRLAWMAVGWIFIRREKSRAEKYRDVNWQRWFWPSVSARRITLPFPFTVIFTTRRVTLCMIVERSRRRAAALFFFSQDNPPYIPVRICNISARLCTVFFSPCGFPEPVTMKTHNSNVVSYVGFKIANNVSHVDLFVHDGRKTILLLGLRVNYFKLTSRRN